MPQDLVTCQRAVGAALIAGRLHPRLAPCIPMTEAEFAALSSVFVLGSLAGALGAGPCANRYGRLRAMRMTSLFFTVGSLLEATAPGLPGLTTGRFLAGIGAGATTGVVPLYLSEVAPPGKRGLFGTITQAMICLGILAAQITGYFLSRGSRWRLILALGALMGCTLGLGLGFLPESPVWLASHRDPARAVRILQRLRGADYPLQEETADWNIRGDAAENQSLLHPSLVSPVGDGEPPRPSLPGLSQAPLLPLGSLELLRTPLYRPALIAVIGIMVSQQLCGINSIIMYSVSLLRGVLPISSAMLTILISVINVATTLVCAPLPDRIGRKSCLLLSITGMGCMSFLLAVSLHFRNKLLSAITVVFYVAFFATGLGPVPYMIASELVGQEAVGAVQSWGLAANYVASILIAQLFPLLNTWMNIHFGSAGSVYFVFAALGAVCGAFVTWRVPETLGKKDLDEVWGRVSAAQRELVN